MERRRWESVVRSPQFWLACEMVIIAAWFYLRGRLMPVEWGDTASYSNYVSEGWTLNQLRGTRPPLYPVVLRLSLAATSDYTFVPLFQMAAYLASVWLFDRAWRAFGASRLFAWAASTGLLVTLLQNYLVTDVLSDCLAMIGAVIVMSLVLLVAANPSIKSRWVWLGLAVIATYLVRPVYQTLLGVVPIVGVVAWLIRERELAASEKIRRGSRVAAMFCATAILPWLAYCSARLVLVAHFGVVSFAGVNLSGVAVELMDEATLPVVRAAVDPRFYSALEHELRTPPKSLLPRKDAIDYEEWQQPIYALHKYDYNLFEVSYPAAKAVYGTNYEQTDIALFAFSKAVIRAKLGVYLRLVLRNILWGLQVCLVVNRGWVVLAVLAYALWIVRVVSARAGLERSDDDKAAQAMFVLVSVFTLLNILAVAAVEVMNERYLLPITVFLPALFGVLAFREAVLIAHAWRLRRQPALRG